MNKNYSLVDPLVFIKEEEYFQQLEELNKNPDKFPRIYFRVNEGTYKNWHFCIDNAQLIDDNNGETASVRCTYNVMRVPKKVTEEEIVKSQPQLDQIINEVFLDILQTSLNCEETNE